MGQVEQEILNSLTLEDLQESYREVAEVIGMEGLKLLSAVFGGSKIYIPKYKQLTKSRVYHCIYNEYDGTNIKKLSKKYDVCEATIYNIIRNKLTKRRKSKGDLLPGQMNIADLQLQDFNKGHIAGKTIK